jgi:hypothetical protein
MSNISTAERLRLMKKAMSTGLRMQPLFDAEPTYRNTEQGSMRSEGTARQQRMKANAQKKQHKVLAR